MFFGLDGMLSAISTTIVIALIIVVAAGLAVALSALGFIIVRDACHEIAIDLRQGRPWRWRFIGLAGLAGILVDGAVGTWNAYQQHILLSAAVEQLPFAGVPLLTALGSYPLKWIEGRLMNRHSRRTCPAVRGY